MERPRRDDARGAPSLHRAVTGNDPGNLLDVRWDGRKRQWSWFIAHAGEIVDHGWAPTVELAWSGLMGLVPAQLGETAAAKEDGRG